MLQTGLTSITFRQLSVDEIIELAAKAELNGIEWGSDVHVPQGELELAAEVRAKTEAAGLTVCSYGSYYRCTEASGEMTDFLETAQALGAPAIRVWAGDKGSEDADQAYRDEVAERLRRMVHAAKELDITIALEYHGGTLTDTQASAHQLLKEVGLPELKLYWQPRTCGTFEGDIPELKAALPHMSHVHCFHWGANGWQDRHALADGIAPWTEYLKLIRQAEGDRYIIFEFVKDDQPEQLLEDAKVLKQLISESN
ncbi:sugar phosphate isomerase/epimerase family protein [Coraliomargarita parva]|uniref:sugar phosphate isomerase/epimerase family protein n=1 Tax=Coraliomargarita parva TaxID=3014050 RepID=UPI0022B30154|nr:sugar phosphate isomerase/epimerase family protein [Coraliomargarita parva]